MVSKSEQRRVLSKVPGYVYCDRIGKVHDDNLDPYEYGPPSDGEEDQRCQPSDHVSVYARQWPD